jgi:hypothetical protein
MTLAERAQRCGLSRAAACGVPLATNACRSEAQLATWNPTRTFYRTFDAQSEHELKIVVPTTQSLFPSSLTNFLLSRSDKGDSTKYLSTGAEHAVLRRMRFFPGANSPVIK